MSGWLSSVFLKENSVSHQKPLIGLIVYLLKKAHYYTSPVFLILCFAGSNPIDNPAGVFYSTKPCFFFSLIKGKPLQYVEENYGTQFMNRVGSLIASLLY